MKYTTIFCCVFMLLQAEPFPSDDKDKKLLYTNLAVGAAVLGWGLLQWDYGTQSMHLADEGWFGGNTEHGGADKLGHTYATYASTRAFAALYRSYGYESEKAALYAAYSSFFVNTLIEVGDAFSSYGFSKEDFIMNTLGSFTGYLFEHYDSLDRMADIRVEYFPSRAVREGDETDIITDYDGMKFLVAFKCDAWESLDKGPMRYLELHVGYYTRGNHDGILERTAYVGLGLNLARMFGGRSDTADTVLEFYQLPYTYLPYERQYDR